MWITVEHKTSAMNINKPCLFDFMLDSRPQNRDCCRTASKSLQPPPPPRQLRAKHRCSFPQLPHQCHLDSDAALHPPAVEGRWVTRLRHVSVNQVEVRDAPASISTRISFSIPRIESANLRRDERRRDISLEERRSHRATA